LRTKRLRDAGPPTARTAICPTGSGAGTEAGDQFGPRPFGHPTPARNALGHGDERMAAICVTNGLGICSSRHGGPNVRRRVRNRSIALQRVIDCIQARPDEIAFTIVNLADFIWYRTLQAKWLIDEIRALQGIAMPDSMAAHDRWSDEPQRGSKIVLRVPQGTFVYHDGRDQCDIDIPAAQTRPPPHPLDA
jgi:hypothetical protein